MLARSITAAAFAAALVANGCVCGVAHSDDCVNRLNGDVTWCQSSGLVNNLSSTWVIGLTPIGNSPAPTPQSAGSALGQTINGQFHGTALLVPPGGSAQIGGPTHVDYDEWGTIALQSAKALCNASKLCSYLAAALTDFENCIQGVANALYDVTNGVMPDPSQIVGELQSIKACRQAVNDMNEKQAEEENKRAVPGETPDEKAVMDRLMADVHNQQNIMERITGPKLNVGEEIGKSLVKGAGE